MKEMAMDDKNIKKSSLKELIILALNQLNLKFWRNFYVDSSMIY